jgi:hypothetical protein
MEVSGEFHATAVLSPEKEHLAHSTAGCVSTRTGLDVTEERKVIYPLKEI